MADIWVNGEMVMPSGEPGETSYTGSVQYDYDSGKVTLTFETLWISIIDHLVVNTVDLSAQLPATKEQLAAHYANQHIKFDVEVDKADTYNITTHTSMITPEQQFMGNFLWENDETDPHAMEDDIIGKGKISFVKAVIDGTTYSSVDDLNSNCGKTYCHWADSIVTEEDPDGSTGGAELPVGTKLTIKLIPDAGYQLVSFGINGGQFEPQATVGEYTFTIKGGNGHLAAKFQAVDNKVLSVIDAIASGSITLGNESSIQMGTARLDVSEAEDLTEEQISNFTSTAEDSGYKVLDYLDLSLYNTVYKGSTTASWDTPVTELDNVATITLQLDDDVDGSSMIVIHEKHDGTYGTIDTVWDADAHTVTFDADSFSNYALAAKPVSAPDSGFATNTAASATSTIATVSAAATVITAAAWIIFRFAKK